MGRRKKDTSEKELQKLQAKFLKSHFEKEPYEMSAEMAWIGAETPQGTCMVCGKSIKAQDLYKRVYFRKRGTKKEARSYANAHSKCLRRTAREEEKDDQD